jgi:hypothetical protein
MDLPQSTEFGRIIPKGDIYKHGGASRDVQDMFAKQVERVRWANKISPDTMNIDKGETVGEIEVIEVALTTTKSDKRILPTIHKAIPYKCIFECVCGGKVTYTVYFSDKIWYTGEVAPKLIGNDLDTVWENIVRQVGGIAMEDEPLEHQIECAADKRRLERDIAALEKKIMREKQFNIQVELNAKLKRLKAELEEM